MWLNLSGESLELTEEEVPHAIAVEITSLSPRDGKDLIDIHANIYVERNCKRAL